MPSTYSQDKNQNYIPMLWLQLYTIYDLKYIKYDLFVMATFLYLALKTKILAHSDI